MCGGSSTTVNIVITATKDAQFPPTLSDGTNTSTGSGDDNFTTNVKSSTVINFTKAGDISSIDGIFFTGGTNLFSTPPAMQRDGSWQGVIGNPGNNLVEVYTIVYTIAGNQYKQDPKLRLNN